MLRRVPYRLFTSKSPFDPRIEQLKGTSISPDQIYHKPGKRVEADRLKTSFSERFQGMKDQFGEDYQTPNERFDLHLPRVEATGEMSTEERFHAKQGFRKGKVVAISAGVFILVGIGIAMRKFYSDYRIEMGRFEDKKKEVEFLRDHWYGASRKVVEERKEELRKLKALYKEKYGVEIDESSSN